jgi:hypothetical protein
MSDRPTWLKDPDDAAYTRDAEAIKNIDWQHAQSVNYDSQVKRVRTVTPTGESTSEEEISTRLQTKHLNDLLKELPHQFTSAGDKGNETMIVVVGGVAIVFFIIIAMMFLHSGRETPSQERTEIDQLKRDMNAVKKREIDKASLEDTFLATSRELNAQKQEIARLKSGQESTRTSVSAPSGAIVTALVSAPATSMPNRDHPMRRWDERIATLHTNTDLIDRVRVDDTAAKIRAANDIYYANRRR